MKETRPDILQAYVPASFFQHRMYPMKMLYGGSAVFEFPYSKFSDNFKYIKNYKANKDIATSLNKTVVVKRSTSSSVRTHCQRYYQTLSDNNETDGKSNKSYNQNIPEINNIKNRNPVIRKKPENRKTVIKKPMTCKVGSRESPMEVWDIVNQAKN